jgi:hypothetical protein
MEGVDPVRGASAAAAWSTMPTPVLSAVADKLGISVDALRSQLAAGRPLSSVAAVAGLAHDALVETVAAARQKQVTPVVADDGGGVLL